MIKLPECRPQVFTFRQLGFHDGAVDKAPFCIALRPNLQLAVFHCIVLGRIGLSAPDGIIPYLGIEAVAVEFFREAPGVA
jgi:hypothetical protein